MLIFAYTVILLMIYGLDSATIKQNQKFYIKQIRKTVFFKCEVTGLGSGDYVHWYHKKDDGTFKRLLYISASGSPTIEAKEFGAEKNGNSYDIKLNEITKEHAGVYYCAYWDGNWIKHFGSGTRLIVTDKAVVEPQLTAYSPSEKHDQKSIMLCQASRMFPDLVKFSWKTKSSSVDWGSVSDDHVVEQRTEKNNEIFVTSMVILDKDTAKNNNYQCTVEHEGTKTTSKSAILKTDKVESSETKLKDDTPNPTCPPSESTKQNLESLDQTPSFKLFVYAYGIMLMKNGVYFAAVCIFLLKRKAGKKDESSQEPSK